MSLRWFFDAWLRGSSLPAWSVSAPENNGESSRVTLTRGGLAVPADVDVRFEDGRSERITAERMLSTQELTFSGRVRSVALDPEDNLPPIF